MRTKTSVFPANAFGAVPPEAATDLRSVHDQSRGAGSVRRGWRRSKSIAASLSADNPPTMRMAARPAICRESVIELQSSLRMNRRAACPAKCSARAAKIKIQCPPLSTPYWPCASGTTKAAPNVAIDKALKSVARSLTCSLNRLARNFLLPPSVTPPSAAAIPTSSNHTGSSEKMRRPGRWPSSPVSRNPVLRRRPREASFSGRHSATMKRWGKRLRRIAMAPVTASLP